MKIEFLTQNRVRVFLTPEDMKRYHIEFDLLDGFDDYTQNVIVQLVDKVKKEGEFDISTGKLFVEVFPNAGKGCVFYLTLLPFDKQAPKNPKIKKVFEEFFVYQFQSINHLVACSKGLLRNYKSRINKSSLFLHNNKTYYLRVCPSQTPMKDMQIHMDEFGSLFGSENLHNAFLNEHCKLLIKDTAIEKLCFFLS